MTTTFKLDVSYNQISVFHSSISQPFNDWTDQHVAQGFAWRCGSVSFRTLVEFGMHSVEVIICEHLKAPNLDVVRAIEVPFNARNNCATEVASIADSVSLDLPEGT